MYKTISKTTITYYQTNDNKIIQILGQHVKTVSGNFKGICVSAVLSYLGIHPTQYKYTNSKCGCVYASILRRFGWSVRSRRSVFSKAKTVGALRRLIRKYNDYCENTYYVVLVPSHIILLNSNGDTIVDTAPVKNDYRKVEKVEAVFK